MIKSILNYFRYFEVKNNYKMMQFVHQVSLNKRPELNKRTSSATFHSKKMKILLSSRQTSDETIICHQHKQSQLPPTVSSRMINYHRKQKSNVELSNQQINVKKCQNKALIEIIKPMKYEKSNEQNIILRNCDKSKLIYWSKDLQLSGSEKYALISLDLLIDQDNFWQKGSSDSSGQFNGNLVSFNYQSTTLTRNRNINIPLPPKNGSNSLNSVGGVNLSKRNPLINWGKVNLFVREWKSLHARVDGQGRRVVVLWVIRRQSSYGYLMEFAQTYQLPLHGIFYVKRKRSNQFFDLGLIVKEIHQKFFQSIITSFTKAQKETPKTLKSIQRNTDLKRSKSKQTNKLFTINNKKHSTQLLSQQNFKQQKQYNDENCQQRINVVQACKSFQLSKNIVINKKKSLISIIRDDERARKVVRKVPSLLMGGMKRPATVKILQSVEKIEVQEKQLSRNVVKRYTSPLIANDDIDTLQIEQLQQDLLVRIQEEQLQQSEEDLFVRKRFIRPQIFVFEGIKCNTRDNISAGSYSGRLPLIFSYHNKRYTQMKQKLSQQGIDIFQSSSEQGKYVKMFYLKYQMARQGMLEKVNSLMRDVTNKVRSCHDQQLICNNNRVYQTVSQVPRYIDSAIASIMSQYSVYMNMKSRSSQQQLQPSQNSNQQQQLSLSQQQQQQLIQKTQKQLQQIKKKMIADVIAMKGRNYTFQNGESVYYYVGGMFKRNYNLMYNQYYAKYEAEMRAELMALKGQEIKSVKNSPLNVKHSTNYPLSNYDSSLQKQSTKITTPHLFPVQFFHFSNTHPIN